MFSLATLDMENIDIVATSPLRLNWNNYDETVCSGSATTISFRIIIVHCLEH